MLQLFSNEKKSDNIWDVDITLSRWFLLATLTVTDQVVIGCDVAVTDASHLNQQTYNVVTQRRQRLTDTHKGRQQGNEHTRQLLTRYNWNTIRLNIIEIAIDINLFTTIHDGNFRRHSSMNVTIKWHKYSSNIYYIYVFFVIWSWKLR